VKYAPLCYAFHGVNLTFHRVKLKKTKSHRGHREKKWEKDIVG
jgi:hypothetical protein|tara:strand:+ start:1934 stop:2062 length:129 start_codon:yes stop_codon:yes gene_type:complete